MFNKILVCLDGSKLAEQILPFAIEQAKKLKSSVTLLQVIASPSSVISGAGSVTGPALHDQIDAEEDEAKKYLSRIVKKLESENIKTDYATLRGTPGHTIVDYAHENQIDLIAIATHGHSGIRRAIVGSVVDHVIRESHLPTLVIKPQ
ncbi:MAG: universal stress protein [Chloroflexi bacterium]|nr:universal stress protein [Chloroflexota bacterium]MBT7290764.1 universal stress protein [Chloroflexota bacterium]